MALASYTLLCRLRRLMHSLCNVMAFAVRVTNCCYLLCRQWWYTQVSIQLLVMLIRHDYPVPVRAAKLLVNCLVHDSLTVRKVCIHICVCLYVSLVT